MRLAAFGASNRKIVLSFFISRSLRRSLSTRSKIVQEDVLKELQANPSFAKDVVRSLSGDNRRTVAVLTATMELNPADKDPLKEADRDSDGRISRPEYRAWLLSRGTDTQLWQAAREKKVGKEVIKVVPTQIMDKEEEAMILENAIPPTAMQRLFVFIRALVPMAGFGFINNFTMLFVGDWIDVHLGVALGLSTLTAAAFGNLVSDITGYSFGKTIEAAADKIGFLNPQLQRGQDLFPETRRNIYLGGATGLAIGCIIGLCPLLWIDPDHGFFQLIFNAVDVLKEGKIGQAEILKAASSYGIDLSSERLQEVFDIVDKDHDGKIDLKEFTSLVHMEETHREEAFMRLENNQAKQG